MSRGMDYNDEPSNTAMDEDIENATISFVPQVGGGNNNNNNRRDRSLLPDNNNNNYSPPGGYGAPPPPPQPQPNAAYAQPPPMPYGNPNKPQPEIMMGQPVMMTAGGPFDYQAFQNPPPQSNSPYPTASAYGNNNSGSPHMMMNMNGAGGGGNFPNQPGAMVLLVQEAQDLDFRAPLCSVNSCIQCVNACFLPYCLLARQQNMLNKGPVDSFRMGPPSGGMPAPMDERKVEEARNRNSDMNGCCAAALVFDIGRIVAAVFVPQIAGSLYFVNGLCLQTLQTRQAIRARFGIAPQQCSDIMISMCCQICATMQQSEEMRLRRFDAGYSCGTDKRPLPNNMR